MECSSCGATSIPIDLDVKATPPEYVCRRCIRKCRCPGCGKRRSRLVLQVRGGSLCHPCINRMNKNAAAYWREFEAERSE